MNPKLPLGSVILFYLMTVPVDTASFVRVRSYRSAEHGLGHNKETQTYYRHQHHHKPVQSSQDNQAQTSHFQGSGYPDPDGGKSHVHVPPIQTSRNLPHRDYSPGKMVASGFDLNLKVPLVPSHRHGTQGFDHSGVRHSGHDRHWPSSVNLQTSYHRPPGFNHNPGTYLDFPGRNTGRTVSHGNKPGFQFSLSVPVNGRPGPATSFESSSIEKDPDSSQKGPFHHGSGQRENGPYPGSEAEHGMDYWSSYHGHMRPIAVGDPDFQKPVPDIDAVRPQMTDHDGRLPQRYYPGSVKPSFNDQVKGQTGQTPFFGPIRRLDYDYGNYYSQNKWPNRHPTQPFHQQIDSVPPAVRPNHYQHVHRENNIQRFQPSNQQTEFSPIKIPFSPYAFPQQMVKYPGSHVNQYSHFQNRQPDLAAPSWYQHSHQGYHLPARPSFTDDHAWGGSGRTPIGYNGQYVKYHESEGAHFGKEQMAFQQGRGFIGHHAGQAKPVNPEPLNYGRYYDNFRPSQTHPQWYKPYGFYPSQIKDQTRPFAHAGHRQPVHTTYPDPTFGTDVFVHPRYQPLNFYRPGQLTGLNHHPKPHQTEHGPRPVPVVDLDQSARVDPDQYGNVPRGLYRGKAQHQTDSGSEQDPDQPQTLEPQTPKQPIEVKLVFPLDLKFPKMPTIPPFVPESDPSKRFVPGPRHSFAAKGEDTVPGPPVPLDWKGSAQNGQTVSSTPEETQAKSAAGRLMWRRYRYPSP